VANTRTQKKERKKIMNEIEEKDEEIQETRGRWERLVYWIIQIMCKVKGR
jgi:hypothetical protein